MRIGANSHVDTAYLHLKQLDPQVLNDRKSAIVLPAFQLFGSMLTAAKKMQNYTIDKWWMGRSGTVEPSRSFPTPRRP